jgi:predicted O-linked N-acetylglucosamine transferase (SPINDLY family)
MPSESLNFVELLEGINNGQTQITLEKIEHLLQEFKYDLGLLTLRAEAFRLLGHNQKSIEAYLFTASLGGGVRSWMSAGMLLAQDRQVDQAILCLNKALEIEPDNDEVIDCAITTLFNNNRQHQGVEFARKQLQCSVNTGFLNNAALLLQGCELYDESVQAFQKILQLNPNDMRIIGSALVPTRFTCDWELTRSLLEKIQSRYQVGDFASAQEFPLTHLTWCSNESTNLEVTKAYVERTMSEVERVAIPIRNEDQHKRIRVGYVSNDFKNHATMHLMIGLLELHDRQKFEIFAYDYTLPEESNYRERFLASIEHHRDISRYTDLQAAQKIANDQIDILIDLKLYTGGGRPGIFSHRAAPVQAAYLGFPGSAASNVIDYIISDKIVTPDESAAHYTEKFCRLPHSYQCNDNQRNDPQAKTSRADHQLPPDAVVYAVFNQSYKVDKGSFSIWMNILQEVEGSVLWLLSQSDSAKKRLSQAAIVMGIDPSRIIFAPFATPNDHIERLRHADVVLDTLICNGHTTTADALWAGVPVVTKKGSHFASRVSESLLRAIDMPELVAQDTQQMISIAKDLGLNVSRRSGLRHQLKQNRSTSPLFDTAKFARNFERAIEKMVLRQRSGLKPELIDV